jgi:hypothetical protein
MTPPRDSIYAGHRHPAEIISYAVWLYLRFPLSLRIPKLRQGSYFPPFLEPRKTAERRWS